MIIGLLLSIGTAIATGVASVLQGLAARRAAGTAAGSASSVSSVGRLVASPLYLAGVGTDVIGFVCFIAALHWLPLFLVQCASAASVGVTAIVGRRVLGGVLGRRKIVLLAGLGVGLVLLASGARPEAASAVSRAAQWWLVVAAIPVLVIGALALRSRDAHAGGVLAGVSGLSFAGTGVASRVLSDAHSVGAVVKAPAAYALAVFGLAGMTFFAAALQKTHVTTATAALFGVETIAASAVGLLALGDTTRPGFVVPTAVGFAAALACSLLLAVSDSTEAPNGGAATDRSGAPATVAQP